MQIINGSQSQTADQVFALPQTKMLPRGFANRMGTTSRKQNSYQPPPKKNNKCSHSILVDNSSLNNEMTTALLNLKHLSFVPSLFSTCR